MSRSPLVLPVDSRIRPGSEHTELAASALGSRTKYWEAHTLAHLYTQVAYESGAALLREIEGPNSHAAFDATLEHASRLFDVVCCPEPLDQTPSYRLSRRPTTESLSDDDRREMDWRQAETQRSYPSGQPNLDSCRTNPLMTRSMLMHALEQQGFCDLERLPSFAALWDALGCEALDVRTFHAVLRCMKLHLLCGALPYGSQVLGPQQAMETLLPPERGFIGVIDWSTHRVEDFYFQRPERPLDMFLTHRDPEMKMRWVHCAGVGRPSILRLAVKYQLHPLPVEDTIQMQQQSMPLVRKYDGNFFVIIPLLRLTPASKLMLERFRDWRLNEASTANVAAPTLRLDPASDVLPCVPQVEQCRLAIFAAGPPLYDTVISLQTEWRTSRLHADGVDSHTILAGEIPIGNHSSLRLSAAECEEPASPGTPFGSTNSCDSFSSVAREIQRDFSVLRAGNASWLMWRMLDVCVDDLAPILSAYRNQLRWFSSHITYHGARVSEDVEKRLLRSKVELDWLQRKVRPMVRVLKHLIKDKAIDPDVTRYLEDVEDHLGTFIEEVSRIIDVCSSLRDEVHAYRDRQQQKVMYVLTLVTILVMPTHLLTGVYGMNFQDPNGAPVVPGLGRLEERRGWVLFWGLSISLTTLIWFTFKSVLKWI